MNLSKKQLLLILPLFLTVPETQAMVTSGIVTQEVGKMDASAFKQAVQDIADAFASGSPLNLEDSMKVSVDPIEKLIASIPGPFVKLFSMIKFDKNLAIYADYDKQIVVISGEYKLPYIIPQVYLDGVIRMSRNLMDQNSLKKKNLVVGKKRTGLNKDQAEALVSQGLQTLLSGLYQSTILNLSDHYKPSVLAETLGNTKGFPHQAEFKQLAPKLKPLDDILEGDIALAFTSEPYYDPFEGYLNRGGLNIVGNFNLMRQWTDKFTAALMKGIGASIDLSKGMRATVFVPQAIMGMQLTLALPGQLKWGIPKSGKVLAQTTRLGLTTIIGGSGLSAGFLEEQVSGGLQIFLPWQKDPLEVDIVFSLDTATNVGVHGFIKDFKLPEIPLELKDGFVEAKINLAELVKLIVDTIGYIASSVGEQAVEVATVGAGTEVTETAEVAETAEEAEDVTKLIMPLSEFGIGFDVDIIGREIKGAFCFEYDPDTEDFGFVIMIELSRGPARPEALRFFMGDPSIKPDPNSFLGIKDLWLLYYELQRKALENIQGMAQFAHLKPMAQYLGKLLDLQKDLADNVVKYFPDLSIQTAYLYIAPMGMMCGNQQYSSGIEIEASGNLFGVRLEGDLVLDIFGLLNLFKALGEKIGGSKGSSKSNSQGTLSQFKSQITDSVTGTLKGVGSQALGKIKGAFGKEEEEGAEPSQGGIGSQVAGAASSVAGVAGGLIGPLIGGLLGGIYGRLYMGKLNVGPLHIESKDGTKGPLFWFNLGFAYPSGPAPEKADIGTSFLIGSLLDGKVKLDVPPGMEGDLFGKLTIGGFDIVAHGQIGTFEALASGGIHLNPLQDNLTLELLNLDQYATELNTEAHNVLTSGASSEQKKLTMLQNAITKLQSGLDKAQARIDVYHHVMAECARNNPPAAALQAIQGQIASAIKKVIRPSDVLTAITQLTDLGFDAQMLATIRSKVTDQLKTLASDPSNPLSNVEGLMGAL